MPTFGGDGVDLAAVKDDLRVALALDDHNAVFGKTVIDADPPTVEREASGLGVDQHLLAAGRIGIGVDVELAAAAAVLDRQVARDADGSRERRGSAEKGHGIAVKIQLNRSSLLDGLVISRAVIEILGVNVGTELDIGDAGAQGRAELRIGGYDSWGRLRWVPLPAAEAMLPKAGRRPTSIANESSKLNILRWVIDFILIPPFTLCIV